MTPEQLLSYDADVAARIACGYAQPLPKELRILRPYEAEQVIEREGPMTFGWYFGAAEDMSEADLQRWAAVESLFGRSLQTVYPDCSIARMHFPVKERNHAFFLSVQSLAKMRRSVRGNLVVLDTDIIAWNRCDPFCIPFDVGVTAGAAGWPLMPFNMGVLFLRDTEGAQLFCDRIMEFSCDVPVNWDPLYISQNAARAVYQALKPTVDIKIFPNEYNYTPNSVDEDPEAYFLHFKGNRKHFMPTYFERLMERTNGAAKAD